MRITQLSMVNSTIFTLKSNIKHRSRYKEYQTTTNSTVVQLKSENDQPSASLPNSYFLLIFSSENITVCVANNLLTSYKKNRKFVITCKCYIQRIKLATYIILVCSSTAVLVSVRSSTAPSSSEIDFGFPPYNSLEPLVYRDKISCLWVRGVLTNEGAKQRHPFKKRYFTAIGLSSKKMVANRHRHAAYHYKHWRRAS